MAARLSPTWSEWPPIYKRLRERRHPGSPYLAKYPEIARIADTRPEAMTGVRVQRNIVVYTKKGTAWLRGERAGPPASPGNGGDRGGGGENCQLLYTLRIDRQDFDPAAFDHNCIHVEPGLELRVAFHPIPAPGGRLTWDEWRKTGADAHSVLADPLFVDAAKRDFRLKPDSPALRLGFKPIPVETIGLRRDEFRRTVPIVEAPGVAARGTFATIRHYEPPRYRRLPSTPSAPRDGLANFFAKADAKKPLTVAYFGGGIHHAGTGWRGEVMKWLRDRCGEVAEIDAGICDCVRGIGFSVYRFRREVLAHRPDLVLVDFAPVGAEANSDTVGRAAEGIVRQAWAADPTLDVLFLHAFAHGDEEDYGEGLTPAAVSASERVAGHYGAPSVCLGHRIARLHAAGKLLILGRAALAWEAGCRLFSADGRRPTAEAHGLYARELISFLEQAARRRQPRPHRLPAPLRPDHYGRARQEPIAAAMLSGRWEKLPAEHALSKRFRRHMPTLWLTRTPGATLTFRFKGTAASVLDLMGPDTGRARVTVDGRVVGIRQRVDRWAYYQRLSALDVASGLPDAVHAVTVELLPDPPSRTEPIEAAKARGHYDPKLFEGVALRLGCLRLLGELVE